MSHNLVTSDLTNTFARVRLEIAYDGTDFGGFQRQNHGKPTIQGSLENAVSKLFDSPIVITGSGRTDAGVHALRQVVHFDAPKDPNKYKLRHALQGLSPKGIAIRKCWLAPPDFHAICSAEKKTYKYYIWNRAVPSPFYGRYSTWVRHPLDLVHFQESSKFIVGNHDFKSFQNTGTEVASTIRNIYSADWKELRPGYLEFTITGNGFLKQMVRNLVGTMLDLQIFNESPQRMAEILEAKDRRAAKKTAPPQGLFLNKVYYPENLDKRCRRL